MKSLLLPVAVASALLLSACGGGGGGGAPAETVGVTLDGTAAKGRIANALVTVHAVRGDGSVDDAVVATVPATAADGSFSVIFRATPRRPYVIRISGQAGTSHQDEVSGQQTLPARFAMRTAITAPAADASVRSNVTPFSEMAVAAAQKRGGLNADSLAAGFSTVSQLIGFDPRTVDVKSTSDAASADEQKLAILLAAVSQMASTGAAGCGAEADGGRTACVVEKLAAAASPDTMKLETGGTDVSAALAAGLNTALATPALRGNVSSAAATTVLNNLACTGTDCLPAPPPTPGADPVATAIAAAKSLLTEVRSDWTALFVSGGTTGVGDLQTQATLFGDAMADMQVPVEMVLKDTSGFIAGVDLYNDFRAGRTDSPSRGRGAGLYASAGIAPAMELGAIGCRLYEDFDLTIPATAPGNANHVGCAVRYFLDWDSGTEYVHTFGLDPAVTAGQFTYRSRARSRVASTGFPVENLPTSSAPARNGTVTVTLDGQGSITAFTASGKLPPAFRMGQTSVIGDHNDWTFTGTRTTASSGSGTLAMSGQVITRDSAGAALGTLDIRSASLSTEPDPGGGDDLSAAVLDVGWTTPSAGFQGSFSVGDGRRTQDGQAFIPTRLAVEGRFSTITGGVATEFATGRLTLSARGVETFQAAQQTSASNFLSLDASFTGTVAAPGRPQLQLTFGTEHRTFERQPSLVSLQYRSLVGGAPRMTVNVTASLGSNGVESVSLGHPAAGLTLNAARNASTANLLLDGSTVVGVLDLDTGVLTFSDGSFVSVELGR